MTLEDAARLSGLALVPLIGYRPWGRRPHAAVVRLHGPVTHGSREAGYHVYTHAEVVFKGGYSDCLAYIAEHTRQHQPHTLEG